MNQTNQAPSAPASSSLPYPPAPPAAKRSRLFYIGMAGVIAGGICCLLSVVLLVLYFASRPKATPVTASPAQNPTETTLLPTSTNAPAVTSQPVSTATPPPPATTGNATEFSDNFSNPSSGWTVDSSAESDSSYNPLGFYEMGVKQAKSYRISLAADAFSRPFNNVLISVRAQPAVGDTGEYGVVCRYQDVDNFYLAGISGNQFYIGKQVKGQWTTLTDPKWQPLPSNTPDAEGYQLIDLSCNDSFIVLQVNGIGAAHVTDDTFSTGDVGLCVWAGDTADRGGYYARAAFDDFSVKLIQP